MVSHQRILLLKSPMWHQPWKHVGTRDTMGCYGNCLKLCFSPAARMHKREEQVSQLVQYIETRHPSDLCGYNGTNFDYILALLHDKNACAKLARDASPPPLDNSNHTSISVEYSNNEMSNKTKAITMATAAGAKNSSHLPQKAMTGHRDARNSTMRVHSIFRRAAGSSSSVSFDCDDESENCKQRTRRKMHFHDEHDSLREIAHGLHFASIAILAFLVLEVSLFYDLPPKWPLSSMPQCHVLEQTELGW